MTLSILIREGKRTNPKGYRASQRILDMLSKDFGISSNIPMKHLGWYIYTIGVFIRKVDYPYVVFIKNTIYITLFCPNGQTISRSDYLMGLNSSISDGKCISFREEFSMNTSPLDNKKVDLGCPKISFGFSMVDNLNDPRHQDLENTFFCDWDKFAFPKEVKHDCY